MQTSSTKIKKTKEPPVKPVRQKLDSHLNLATITPLNESQRQMLFALSEGMNVVAFGSAGTGKSLLSCYHALKLLFTKKTDKIIIIRNAVATRDMGFLPGNLDEKADPYKAPYKQIINFLCKSGTAWDILVKKEMIEFITTSYVRGITLSDAVVIVDEFANLNWHEANSVITRIGENCQLIMIGDYKQCDLKNCKTESCFNNIIDITKRMPDWFDIVEFTKFDIVRSAFVKEWIIKAEEVI